MSAYSSLSFISQGDAAVSLKTKGTGLAGISELLITIYGEAFPLLDIAFEYKTCESDYWNTDAVLVSGDGIEGNILKGLACSPTGIQHIAYWSHKSNGLSDGQECFTRIRILPSISLFLTSTLGTWTERVSSHEPELFIDKTVVNKDRSGNLLCIAPHSIEIFDSEGLYVSNISISGSPSFALQKSDGNYLILDSLNCQVLEVAPNYIDVIRTTDLSFYIANPPHMAYDELTQNILVSGGDIPKVFEFTYGDGDYGSLLWEHGNGVIGDGVGELNSPIGVSYAEDRSVVYIADWGNNRVVKVDRKTSPEIINSIQVGDVQVPVNLPKFIQSVDNDSVLIVEEQGEQEFYSRIESSHPSLSRYRNSNPDRTTDKNNLPEYNNLLFAPLMNIIVKNAKWESSSSSSFNSSSSSLSSSSLTSLSSISSYSSPSSDSNSSQSSLSSSTGSSYSTLSSSSSIEQAKIYISAQGFIQTPEWIEVTNTGPYARNMTGWYILSHEQPPPCPVATPTQKYSFPSGFILNGGASVRIYSGSGSGSWNNNPPTSLWWGIGSRWHDLGDIGDLYNHQGKLISTIKTGNCI